MVPPVYQLSTLTTESFHDAPAQEFPPPPDGLPSPRPGPPLPLLPFNIAPHNFFPFLPPSSGLFYVYQWGCSIIRSVRHSKIGILGLFYVPSSLLFNIAPNNFAPFFIFVFSASVCWLCIVLV